MNYKPYTVWCCYNVVNFLTNIHKRYPIARPSGRGLGCFFVGPALIHILPEFLQLFMQYLTISVCVMTALNCICIQYTVNLLKYIINTYMYTVFVKLHNHISFADFSNLMADVKRKNFVSKCTEYQPKCCYWLMLINIISQMLCI